ncbi:janus kinase and microtubule-interacting protein 3-like, partial [Pseudomyrmex gracilis]|uniref:janus kinase and microtubule-interacting protein 3-like n=1 Tax=Pseudomyrmex gracilis TaxID=219809 RepID=UPI000994A243
MRKLRENERDRPTSYIEKNILSDNTELESYVCAIESDRPINEIEVKRLRKFALEQQKVIKILRQTVKERQRKLEQLYNKKKKEEFYRQWLELEPVTEVDDEGNHEDNDSVLSSAPSSISPQPGRYDQCYRNGITREAYKAVVVKIEELQSKLFKEQQEMSRAKIQICDLEKALLHERCTNCDKEFVMSDLNEKLRTAEEREATLLIELSELREQNELLEFRLLELEETSVRKDSFAHAANSIISAELSLANKDHLITKQRSRAIATVLPYTNNTTVTKTTPSALPRKLPLILQESGIFNEEEEGKEWEEHEEKVELASRSTQTEVPSSELLQEVQRLQELRTRIQERVKIITPVSHSIDSSKICFDITAMNSIIQLASYQERVHDLEKKLEVYEEVEKIRECEKQLSKQREEELLDENYRLTEKIYWLETKLHHITESNFDENNSFGQNTANGEKKIVAHLKKNTEQIQDLKNMEADMQDQAKITETYVNKVIVKCINLQYKDQTNVNSNQIVSEILHNAI